MKSFTNLPALVLLVPVLAACGSTPSQAEPAGGYESTLNEAKTLYQEVDALGNAWVNTEEFITKAEEAAKTGNMDEAMKLLGKAISEAKLARIQHEEQKNAGPYLF